MHCEWRYSEIKVMFSLIRSPFLLLFALSSYNVKCFANYKKYPSSSKAYQIATLERKIKIPSVKAEKKWI